MTGAILSDGFLRGGEVSSEEGFDALGLGKQVSRVSQLRCLDGDHLGEVEDILLTEKVESPCPLAELVVVERVIIGLPRDLSDIEVARNAEVPAEATQLCPWPSSSWVSR
jgi:hypothetical protein